MTLEPELLEMMTDDIGIELYQTQDVQNHPVYGPKVLYPCYVSERPRLTLNATNGAQAVSAAKAIMAPTSRDGTQSLVYPSLRSRVTLPSGRVTSILSLATMKDETGIHHYEVYTV